MTRLRQLRHTDDGVSLILVLFFIVIAGGFATVALSKSSATIVAGGNIITRGQLQYALDAGVERGLQGLRQDLQQAAPSVCTSPPAAPPLAVGAGPDLTINGQTVHYTCQTLAGRAAVSSDDANTNYGILVTSPFDGALTTQSGSDDLLVGGSIFLNGKVANSDLNKVIQVTTGDLVSPTSATCQANLDALANIQLTGSGQLRTCTEQTVAQALPVALLGTAPTVNVSTTLASGLAVTVSPGHVCQVFYPGMYTVPPILAAANYFVSGKYYFNSTGLWQITGGNSVIGGQRLIGTDTAVPTGDCATMTDSTAMSQAGIASLASSISPYRLSSGNLWIFGGSSHFDMKKGSVVLFTPPAVSGSIPVNIVGVPATANGYTQVGLNADVVTGSNNNTSMQLSANLYAPTGHVDIFSTNGTVATAQAGVIAYTLLLKASNSGTGGVLITASPTVRNPPPPFRTVRIVVTDASAVSTASNTAVATISNFYPFTTHVLSFRTG
jgi:hypothetical protein